MQSYPSPTPIAADSGGPFYPSSSNQPHADSSADDLQLSAQLSRGIAPMMNAGSGGPMAEGQGSRAQDNANHQFEHEQDVRRHAHMHQGNHSPIDHMGAQYSPQDGSVAPRKRSKVSRACDECRRKKIRCDATGDPGDEQCSSCKRTAARCQFSRVPMKRGPSKGYIKELADRLNTLEGAIHHGGDMSVPTQFLGQSNDGLHRESDEFSPPPNPEGSQRKRTHSSISGDFNSPYPNQRPPSAWPPPQDQPRQFPQSSYAAPQSGHGPLFRDPDYSSTPNGLPPTPQWRNSPELHRQSSSFEGVIPIEHGQIDHKTELSDAIIEEYYNTIHPTYPILSQSESRLRSRLSNCPPSLKQAFHEALHAAVRSTASPSATQQSTQKATQLVASFHFESAATHSTSTNLVLLQIMMLLVIEAETHATKALSGPSPSVLLGSAVGLAYSLKLHFHKHSEEMAESDPDSDDKLGRRIWWGLVIMDRWHASSTSSPILIPDGSVVVYPEDQALLGESLYQLARLSVILGHFAEAALAPTDLPPLSIPPSQLVGTLLRGELERWRESLPSTFFPSSNSPLVHICYWHLRILMELRLPQSEPSELLAAASNTVTQLSHNPHLVSPLTYHSTALAALVLLELTGHESAKEEADRNLTILSQNRIAPSAWNEAIRDLIHKKQSATAPNVAESKDALMAIQNLQHLAELATATTEGRESAAGKEGEKTSLRRPSLQRYQELRGAIRTGYLSYILGGESGL